MIERRLMQRAVCSTILLGGLICLPAAAVQSSQAAPVREGGSSSEENRLAETRAQLMSYLRMSPTMAIVVASDSSLLADKEYVTRNNPELARFLEAHPEIVRNPDFYLFANIPAGQGRRVEGLQRKLWPDRFQDREEPIKDIIGILVASLGFLVSLGALLWLIKTLVDNRRWNRIFKMQNEVHGKLIERFGSNEELLGYMQTDAGKRFLEAAPIPVNFENDKRIPSVLGRVLFPLQAGIVLTLLGAGLLYLRHSLPEAATPPLLVVGVVVLMPGLGLIVSAAITWLLAARLGLMPKPEESDVTGGRL